ncbi:hypothetical protein [Streptomyces sp. NPDC091268]|uniref:hypothetical protein n=1 Tax=Streptomyces sp. NPDC091268 TaxID=3365979 RepID=UPI00380B575B
MNETDPVLPAPAVEEADDNGVITHADARSGVNVIIPAYANFTDGDRIKLFWGGQGASDPYTVPQGEGDKPIILTVPWDTVAATGEGAPLVVHYQVFRAGGGVSISEPTEIDLQQP